MHHVNPFAGNPLKTRDQIAKLVRDLVAPLDRYRSEGQARISLGGHATVYTRNGIEMEGFSRPLWGLIPYGLGGFEMDWSAINTGLANGTNPDHPDFWGTPLFDHDQKFVEMAAIGFGLLANPDGFAQLSDRERDNLFNFLAEIDNHKVPDNNWHFFRVLVNCGLKKQGYPASSAALQSSLDAIDSYYLGEGWYADGNRPHIDWYIPFAMHFYGLLYAELMGDQDPERSARYKERAIAFASDHALWFGADGAAIPFGRSMTYRFAQSSFWAALAYCGVEALPWGEIKSHWLSHIRWWSRRPIFDRDGVMSVGYGYPNLTMAEPYNSASSPYWAMKAFLPLALPEEHPFWQAEEIPVSTTPISKTQPHARMILNRDESHAWALAGGQENRFFAKCAEKYGKFAYSSTFGFCAENTQDIQTAALDSTLALSDDAHHFRLREHLEHFDVSDDGILTVHRPFGDVEVSTWLAPIGRWHLRVHRVTTPRALLSIEGGFSLPISKQSGVSGNAMAPIKGDTFLANDFGLSGIVDPTNSRKGRVLFALPNSNVIWPKVAVPQLVHDLPAGETLLYSLVFAGTSDAALSYWHKPPDCNEKIEFALRRIRGE